MTRIYFVRSDQRRKCGISESSPYYYLFANYMYVLVIGLVSGFTDSVFFIKFLFTCNIMFIACYVEILNHKNCFFSAELLKHLGETVPRHTERPGWSHSVSHCHLLCVFQNIALLWE